MEISSSVVVISSAVREPAAAGSCRMGVVGMRVVRVPHAGMRAVMRRAAAPSSRPGGGPSPGKRARAPASAISPARMAPSRGRKTMA